jgi:hypothetical protein
MPAAYLFCQIPAVLTSPPTQISIRTFSSASVKPRPRRVRRLYLMVLRIAVRIFLLLQCSIFRVTNGHRTIGRSLSTGRGATAAAFARRARRRVTFLPGYFPSHTSELGPSRMSCVPGDITNLVEVAPHTPLPLLAEV